MLTFSGQRMIEAGMTLKVLAIVNPVSGRRPARPLIEEVGRILAARGADLHIECTNHQGHATQLAQSAHREFGAILVGGGDGTVSEVINGLCGTTLPLVILGTGTENLLARELSMPTTAVAAADALLHGRSLHLDVGIVNGRRFLVVVGVGFDAEVVKRLTEMRRGNITHFTYVSPIWRTFWNHRFPTLRIEADGERVFEGRGMAYVGVTGRYARGLRILTDARPDDGLLDLCVMPCATRRRLVSLACSVVLQRHRRRADVIYRQVRAIDISSPDEDTPVEIDGDCGGTLPVECRIEPRSAVLLQPAT